jgi:hypothetical protein
MDTMQAQLHPFYHIHNWTTIVCSTFDFIVPIGIPIDLKEKEKRRTRPQMRKPKKLNLKTPLNPHNPKARRLNTKARLNPKLQISHQYKRNSRKEMKTILLTQHLEEISTSHSIIVTHGTKHTLQTI